MKTLIRSFVCTVGALLLTGCWSWRPTSPGENPAPAAVKVTLSDHSVVYVRGARLEGDSVLVGRGPTSEVLQIPLRDIASVTRRSFDPAQTMTLVGLSVPVLFFALIASLGPGD